jgi:hypothetical protein
VGRRLGAKGSSDEEALCVVVASLVGRGGGGGGVDKSSGAYQGAFDSYSAVPLKQLAAEYGVETTPEAVADYIGKSIVARRPTC